MISTISKRNISARRFKLLSNHELVFGPVSDGGFWSIGVEQQFFQQYGQNITLLNKVRWSTQYALEDTKKALNQLNTVYSQAGEDVDDIESYKNYLSVKSKTTINK